MRTSKEGLALIKAFETFVPYLYDDGRGMIEGRYVQWHPGVHVGGTLTIGYGHTNAAGPPRLVAGMKFTEEEASQVLARDLNRVEKSVNSLVCTPRAIAKLPPLLQREFDAVVSFHFNCGGLTNDRGQASGARRALLANDHAEALREMHRWIHPAWARAGLIKRRNAEEALFRGKDWRPFVP